MGRSIVKKWRNESLLVVGQKNEEEFQNHTMILNELLGRIFNFMWKYPMNFNFQILVILLRLMFLKLKSDKYLGRSIS